MESIEIEGFLTISKAHFEIKKINILIGTQASGKSIVAKLVYFFKKFFSDIFIESIEKNQNKSDARKNKKHQRARRFIIRKAENVKNDKQAGDDYSQHQYSVKRVNYLHII